MKRLLLVGAVVLTACVQTLDASGPKVLGTGLTAVIGVSSCTKHGGVVAGLDAFRCLDVAKLSSISVRSDSPDVASVEQETTGLKRLLLHGHAPGTAKLSVSADAEPGGHLEGTFVTEVADPVKARTTCSIDGVYWPCDGSGPLVSPGAKVTVVVDDAFDAQGRLVSGGGTFIPSGPIDVIEPDSLDTPWHFDVLAQVNGVGSVGLMVEATRWAAVTTPFHVQSTDATDGAAFVQSLIGDAGLVTASPEPLTSFARGDKPGVVHPLFRNAGLWRVPSTSAQLTSLDPSLASAQSDGGTYFVQWLDAGVAHFELHDGPSTASFSVDVN